MIETDEDKMIDRLQKLGKSAASPRTTRQLRIDLPGKNLIWVGACCFCVGAAATLTSMRAIVPPPVVSETAQNFIVQEISENRNVTPEIAKEIIRSVAPELLK